MWKLIESYLGVDLSIQITFLFEDNNSMQKYVQTN